MIFSASSEASRPTSERSEILRGLLLGENLALRTLQDAVRFAGGLLAGGGHDGLRFVVGALTNRVRLSVSLANDLLALARSGGLVGLRLLGGAEALLDLRSTLVHRLVDARQRVASDEEQDDEQNEQPTRKSRTAAAG